MRMPSSEGVKTFCCTSALRGARFRPATPVEATHGSFVTPKHATNVGVHAQVLQELSKSPRNDCRTDKAYCTLALARRRATPHGLARVTSRNILQQNKQYHRVLLVLVLLL